MLELGLKSGIVSKEIFEKINVPDGPRLSQPPRLKDGFCLVCGIDEGQGERLYVCRSSSDIHEMNKRYGMGAARGMNWYQSPCDGLPLII